MTNSQTPDQYELFVALFARHERAIRAVVRSMLPTNQDADDVMQEIGLACWHKFPDFQPDDSQTEFFRWACVIARFEVLRLRRKYARDRLVLSEETIQRLAMDAEDRSAVAEIERQALEECMKSLQSVERRLLMSIHTRGDSVAQIAQQLGRDARRLYRKLNALRDLLSECVKRKVAEGGT